MDVFTPVLFLLGFAFVLVWRSLSRDRASKLKTPPGSLGLPWLGQSRAFAKNKPLFIREGTKKYGPMWKCYILGRPTVILTNPDHIKFVYNQTNRKFGGSWPASFAKLLGSSTLVVIRDPVQHAMIRKFLTKPLSNKRLSPWLSVLSEECHQAVDRMLASSGKGEAVPMAAAMRKLAFSLGFRLVFGRVERFFASREEWLRFQTEFEDDFSTVAAGLFVVPVNLPFTKYGKAVRARDRAREKIKQLVDFHVAETERNPGADLHYSLLDLMRRGDPESKARPLTQDEMTANALGILFAGRETLGLVLVWAMLRLSQREDIRTQVLNELRSVPEVSMQVLTNGMPLTDLVLKECLRVPAVSYVFREALEDVELGGYVIPKGWRTASTYYHMATSKDMYPNPAEFDPFVNGVTPGAREFQRLVFGTGPRICPGRHFAMLGAKVFLHTVLTRTTFWDASRNKVDDRPNWTLLKANPMRCDLHFSQRKEEARPAPEPAADALLSRARHDVVQAFIRLFDKCLRNKTPYDEFDPRGREMMEQQVAWFVERGLAIQAVVLAFPVKSPNVVGRVLGPRPDLGEQLALLRLHTFCDEVSKLYPPGCQLTIMSDGRVYGNLLGVSTEGIVEYNRALRAMSNSQYLKWDNLTNHVKDDGQSVPDLGPFTLPNCVSVIPASRVVDLFTAQFAAPITEVEQRLKVDPEFKRVFVGFRTLVYHDLWDMRHKHGFTSRNQTNKECKKVTRQMMSRYLGFSKLCKQVYPRHIRFSIHAHSNAGPKFGIVLVGRGRMDDGTRLRMPWGHVPVVPKSFPASPEQLGESPLELIETVKLRKKKSLGAELLEALETVEDRDGNVLMLRHTERSESMLKKCLTLSEA